MQHLKNKMTLQGVTADTSLLIYFFSSLSGVSSTFSMSRYLQPIQVSQVVHLLQEL